MDQFQDAMNIILRGTTRDIILKSYDFTDDIQKETYNFFELIKEYYREYPEIVDEYFKIMKLYRDICEQKFEIDHINNMNIRNNEKYYVDYVIDAANKAETYANELYNIVQSISKILYTVTKSEKVSYYFDADIKHLCKKLNMTLENDIIRSKLFNIL